MALNRVVFQRGRGGLGRPLTGKDHVSGMVFYITGPLPSGFATDDRIKKVFSVDEAEVLGIVDDHSDETKGTGGKVVISGVWLAGETASILIDGGVLATFIVVAGSTAISDVVTGLKNAVNAGTNAGLKHGWSAGETGGTDVDLTQPDRLGLKNNAGGITFVETSVGTGDGTPTQFTGGAGSQLAYIHYHISEYFRLQPDGELFVSLNAQNAYDATELTALQTFANGEIRQSGVYVSHETYVTSHSTVTQGVLDTLETANRPMTVVFHSDFSTSTLSTLATLTTLSNERVTVVIGEEGDWHQLVYSDTKAYQPGDKVIFQGDSYVAKIATTGNAPWGATKWTVLRENLQVISGFSIGTMGVVLGTVSLASVHENIAWPEKFNLVTGTGLDEIAFATGDLDKDVSDGLKDSLDDFHFVFLRKHDGISGSFNTDSWTAITETDDFATQENVRTIDKAVRNIRINQVPNLNRPLFVNDDGTLTEDTIALFKDDAERATLKMITDGELSGPEDGGVTINPSQNVLSTSKIVIGVKLIPVGVAREIEVNIGFAVNAQTV